MILTCCYSCQPETTDSFSAYASNTNQDDPSRRNTSGLRTLICSSFKFQRSSTASEGKKNRRTVTLPLYTYRTIIHMSRFEKPCDGVAMQHQISNRSIVSSFQIRRTMFDRASYQNEIEFPPSITSNATRRMNLYF